MDTGMIYRAMRRLTLLVIFLTALSGGRTSARPSLPAVKTESAPTIDGDLSDAVWQSAPKISEFYHIESGSPAPEQTAAWIAYDDKNIYVAFDCKDSHPEVIRAQQTKRGGTMDEDDNVSLYLDPFSEYRWAALNRFRVNAIGTQWHAIQSAETGKTEWIGDWDAAVKRNADGYSVEMRIPFSILKYDSNNPRIGVGFNRYNARLRQEWWAPDIGKNQDLSTLCFWEGIKPPAYRPRPIILVYSMLGTGSGDQPHRLGLDFKHALTPSLSGLLTVNPDFRNVEQEVDSVDFTYTERWLEDRRPFFREGTQYFPGSRVCYTRRIGEIDAGAKLVGLVGKTKLVMMNASTFGDESFTVGQVGRQFGPNGDHYAWFGGALSEVETGSYLTSFTTIGGLWRRTEKRHVGFNYDYLNTGSSRDPKHGHLARYSAWSDNGARRLEWFVRRSIADTDFDPYLGIEQDVGLREWESYLWRWDVPKEGSIRRWELGVESYLADHLDGSRFYNYVAPFVTAMWRNGRSLELSYTDNDRPPNHDRFYTIEYGWKQNDIYRAGGLELSLGKLVGGDYTYISLEQGTRLSDRLSAQIWLDYRRIDEPSAEAGTFRQTVISANYDITPERGFGGRLIRREGRSNVYTYYRQKVRAGMDAYLIYGDPNADETEDTLLLKLIWPM